MQLPADICEGWWWLVHAGEQECVRLWRADVWMMWRAGENDAEELSAWLNTATAMERVAPASWERADG